MKNIRSYGTKSAQKSKSIEGFTNPKSLIAIFIIMSLLITSMALYTTNTARAASSISITSPVPTTECLQSMEVELTGTAIADAPPGNLDQYAIQINWGDGIIQNDIELGSFDNIGNKKGISNPVNYSEQHTYSTAGSYTISVKIYHTNAPGQDNPAEDMASVGICIAPTEFHELTVNKAGSGTGTVMGTGINCGFDCSETYEENTIVVLTASPDIGSTFTGWSGACLNVSGTCSITMNVARSVTATFVVVPPTQHTLSVIIDGSGSVTSSPSGISCALDCTEDYNENLPVELTPNPQDGWSFTGWSGDCSGSTIPCLVTMSSDKIVTANFIVLPPNQYQLTVTTDGNGTGNVTGSGINCPDETDCIESYDNGTNVILNATAVIGSTFSGWSGDCSGASTCSIDMSQARSVVATFTLNPVGCTDPLAANFNRIATEEDGSCEYTLTITTDNPSSEGSGSVAGNGISCSTESSEQNICHKTYPKNTPVSLTVTPGENSTFDGSWAAILGNPGTCTGINQFCTITMSGNVTINAHFGLNPITPTPTPPPPPTGGGGGGGVSNSVSGVVYHDVNGNGTQDAGEPVLPNWVVYLDSNNNGQFDNGEYNATTNVNGSFTMYNVPYGTSVLREVVQSGWNIVSPSNNGHSVNIAGNTTISNLAFGNNQGQVLGATTDAPTTGKTLPRTGLELAWLLLPAISLVPRFKFKK